MASWVGKMARPQCMSCAYPATTWGTTSAHPRSGCRSSVGGARYLARVTRTVLSERALQRAVLARQRLLERADASIAETLSATGGLQAQYAPSTYLGLWSRMRSLARADLTTALERREVVQGTLQRITIHLVDPDDYWPFALAVREPRRRWWLRSYPQHSEAELTAAAETVRVALADGPLSRKQI